MECLSGARAHDRSHVESVLDLISPKQYSMKDQSSNWDQLGGFVRSAAEVSIAPAKDSPLQLGQLSEMIGQSHPQRLHQSDCHNGPATHEADRCHLCGVNVGCHGRESTTMEHLLLLV